MVWEWDYRRDATTLKVGNNNFSSFPLKIVSSPSDADFLKHHAEGPSQAKWRWNKYREATACCQPWLYPAWQIKAQKHIVLKAINVLPSSRNQRVSVSCQLSTSTYYRPLQYGDILRKCLAVLCKCVVSERPLYFRSRHCANCAIALCWLWILSVGRVFPLQIRERPTLTGATIRQKQQKKVLAVMQELQGTAALYYLLVWHGKGSSCRVSHISVSC